MANITSFFVTFFLSVFSTTVMSYISMATPIGPWIGPTLVLVALLLFRLLRYSNSSQEIALVTAAGSVGGILATALGFSFPTLYFLNAPVFNTWLAQPFYFVSVVAGLSLSAGLFGMWIATVFERRFLVQEQLPFPIGQLLYKMIAAGNQFKKAVDLTIGFFSSLLLCIGQDGIGSFKGLLPKAIVIIHPYIIAPFRIPLLRLDLWPMLWAIGFVTGHVIAIPLLIGALCKIIVIDPVNNLFFSHISGVEFVLAFCSGMILAGTLFGLLSMPITLFNGARKAVRTFNNNRSVLGTFPLSLSEVIQGAGALLLTILFLSFFEFSFACQWYLILGTLMCTYQIIGIAGEIGLAPLGRFATFVMVPALFLFNLNHAQIVIIATYVEIAGGVAADILFGRKMAQLANIPSVVVQRYQYGGLVLSSLSAGLVFWLLINRFGLGSDVLFAYKAQGRQLLLDAHHFNYYVLALGFVFGYLLKYVKVNPMLVLGGLLMPLNISIGLILGGLITTLTSDKQEWFPFWSGVFAANSIWMLVQTLL